MSAGSLPVLAYYPYWTTARYSFSHSWLNLDFIDVVGHYGVKPSDSTPGAVVDPPPGWLETSLITDGYDEVLPTPEGPRPSLPTCS